jgi:2-methylisocitrate lyase-like PEP mutase family enzyme
VTNASQTTQADRGAAFRALHEGEPFVIPNPWDAGADVLFAPGLRTADDVRAVCDAVQRPVNVLAHKGLSMREIAEAGGQRVSVGGGLAWVAVNAMVEAAERIRDGDFSAMTGPGRVRDWLAG